MVALVFAGCSGGGGGGSLKPTELSVTGTVQVSWSANRESGVNKAGGGYRVFYSKVSGFDVAGANFVNVPYVSGATAPTTAPLSLASGTYFVKVVAYSALNPNGSAPSAQITVKVPFVPVASVGVSHG